MNRPQAVGAETIARRAALAALLALCCAGCPQGEPDPDPSNHGSTTVTDSAVGTPCAADDDCAPSLGCTTEAPGGYCTASCTPGSCPSGSMCVPGASGESVCRQRCEAPDDCRVDEGYACIFQARGQRVCLPGTRTPAPKPGSFDETRRALAITCEATDTGATNESGFPVYELDFTMPDGATAAVLVAHATSGRLEPVELRGPMGALDLVDDYRHQNLQFLESQGSVLAGEVPGTTEIGSAWPLVFPYAPQYEDSFVAGGAYTLSFASSEQSPCLYVLGGGSGEVIDLNIYFANTTSLQAGYAETSEDFAEVLGHLESIYAEAGIRLGRVRTFDLPEEDAERHAIVRDYQDVYELTALGSPPEPTLDGHLSVDVFLVDTIMFAQGNLVGASGGLPGLAGLHGAPGTGVVLSLENLGSHNENVAHILAHELGHFLGLRHTTEMVHGSGSQDEQIFEEVVGDQDPLEDTPLCDDVLEQAWECPDADNLMFPAAPEPGRSIDATLTASQGSSLQRHPLVKAPPE